MTLKQKGINSLSAAILPLAFTDLDHLAQPDLYVPQFTERAQYQPEIKKKADKTKK